ncbi:hypothetical protein RUM43_012955 [Polyplax serrata]|uniref:Uncharacterized protein n=1 Tax=Polyplax serrata TaxID=468196 RepID=A0AAN8P147_POLSC
MFVLSTVLSSPCSKKGRCIDRLLCLITPQKDPIYSFDQNLQPNKHPLNPQRVALQVRKTFEEIALQVVTVQFLLHSGRVTSCGTLKHT